jgi:hypothetical protein
MELKNLLEKFDRLEYKMDVLVQEASTINKYGQSPKHLDKLTKLITKLPVTKDNFAETSRRLNNSVYRDVYNLKKRRENLTSSYYGLMDYATIKLMDCGFNAEDISIYPNEDNDEIKNVAIKKAVLKIRDTQDELINAEPLTPERQDYLIQAESNHYNKLVEAIAADKSLVDIEKRDVATMYAMIIETSIRLDSKLKLMEREQTRAKNVTSNSFINYNRGSNSKTPRADRVIAEYNIQLEEKALAKKGPQTASHSTYNTAPSSKYLNNKLNSNTNTGNGDENEGGMER